MNDSLIKEKAQEVSDILEELVSPEKRNLILVLARSFGDSLVDYCDESNLNSYEMLAISYLISSALELVVAVEEEGGID